MHQQLWGYKVEEKIYLGERELKRMNITVISPTQLQNNKMKSEPIALLAFHAPQIRSQLLTIRDSLSIL